MPDKVLAEVKAGQITEATINDNVSRILRVIFLSGILIIPIPPAAKSTLPRSAPSLCRAQPKASFC